MQDIDITSTQSLIDRYYEEEKAQREKEQTLASVITRLDASDLAMLSVISKRFRKSREEVAQEVLSSALVDLFSRVDAAERKLMARDADESAKSIAHEIAEENGVHNIEFKGGAWAAHDRNITKSERKKARQEEARKQAEQTPQQATVAESATSKENTAEAVDKDTTHQMPEHMEEKSEAAAFNAEHQANDEAQEPASMFAS